MSYMFPLHSPHLVTDILLPVFTGLPFLYSTYKWYHIVLVFPWFISLCIMCSRSIHAVVNDKMSFSWINNVFLCHIFFVVKNQDLLMHAYVYIRASLVAQLVKNSPAKGGDLGSSPGLGRSPGEGEGCSLQYSGLENSKDYIVHGVT